MWVNLKTIDLHVVDVGQLWSFSISSSFKWRSSSFWWRRLSFSGRRSSSLKQRSLFFQNLYAGFEIQRSWFWEQRSLFSGQRSTFRRSLFFRNNDRRFDLIYMPFWLRPGGRGRGSVASANRVTPPRALSDRIIVAIFFMLVWRWYHIRYNVEPVQKRPTISTCDVCSVRVDPDRFIFVDMFLLNTWPHSEVCVERWLVHRNS